MSHVQSFVVTLKGKKEFDKFVTSNSNVLVDFSTVWCHWCKVLAPEYKAAAEALHNEKGDEKTKTKLVYVDGDEEENAELLQKYKVDGFPTLQYFQNGDLENPQDYSGDRDKTGIVSWCKKRVSPAVTPLTNLTAFSEFVKSNTNGRKIAIVVWRKGDVTKDKTLKVIYELAEKKRDEFSVGHVTEDSLAKECGLSSHLTLFRSFDTPVVALEPKGDDDITVENVLELIVPEKFTLVGEITRENGSDYLSSGLPLAWVMDRLDGEVDEKSGDKKQQLVTLFKPFAEKNKGKLLFVVLNVNVFKGHADSMGVSKIPALVIQQNNDKYVFNGDFTDNKALADFVDAWKNGKLSPFRKTEAPPETQDPEGAFVLVGSTFENHVGTKDKDAFVDFYADWCGPCQKMAPTYKELAKKFKNVPELIIAKINADKNETFQKIESYPTLLFFKKGTREGIKYTGDRSLSSFVEFVKANATVDCSSVTI